jgi:hypothetical protein
MIGFITEQHLAEAEAEFPGITRFFACCTCKPRTFLELVAQFEHWADPAPERARAEASPAARKPRRHRHHRHRRHRLAA